MFLRFAAGLLAALLAWTAPVVAADDAPKVPSKIYAVVFGVVFDAKGDVDQLRMVRVLDIREGNKDATDVVVPDRFVTAVRKMLASPRYKPKPADVKPEEIFTYFFFDPQQPDRANLDPRPKQR